MHPALRGLVAVPVYAGYALACLYVAGQAGVIPIVLGAVAVGYVIGAPWAFLSALPLVVAGIVNLDEPGPLENTDDGWGLLILIAVALPATVGIAIGAGVRSWRRADRTRPRSPGPG